MRALTALLDIGRGGGGGGACGIRLSPLPNGSLYGSAADALGCFSPVRLSRSVRKRGVVVAGAGGGSMSWVGRSRGVGGVSEKPPPVRNCGSLLLKA